MVAFSGFYESHKPPPLGDARGIVPLHRDGHQNGQQSGYMWHYPCVDCHPGSCRGDKERVVAQWRRSVASGEALVMPHWVICSVSHWRTTMAIEMTRDGGTFVRRRRRLFRLCNHSQGPCYGPVKLIASFIIVH
jgi:hypothetical protein